MIIHYNCTIGSILLDSFLLIYHPYPPSFHEMIFILVYMYIYLVCLGMDRASSAGDTEVTEEALQLMKLPQYVVNCLVAAGFDTLNVIAYMDVSSNSGNSIEEVEGYIRTEHPEWLPNGKFSPGHRLRIRLFVEEVQKSFTPKVTLGKGKRVCGSRDAKGKKHSKQSDSQTSVFSSTHRQIAKAAN